MWHYQGAQPNFLLLWYIEITRLIFLVQYNSWEKILCQKNCWFRKILLEKILGPENVVSKTIWAQQLWFRKKMFVEKIWSQKSFGITKYWQTKFWDWKIWGSNIFLVVEIFAKQNWYFLIIDFQCIFHISPIMHLRRL